VKSVQTRLKRSFGTVPVDDPSGQMMARNATTPAPTPVPGPINADSIPTVEAPMAQDTSTPTSDGAANLVSDGPLTMRGIMQELIEAVKIDDKEPPEPSPGALSIPIKNLFDFMKLYWVEGYSKLAMQGLQDELELYELLDLDAEGVKVPSGTFV
jgi:hypothetical protein